MLCKGVEKIEYSDRPVDWCARDCDADNHKIFATENCNKIACKCVCYKVSRNDDDGGTCETEQNDGWNLYRLVDGAFVVLIS